MGGENTHIWVFWFVLKNEENLLLHKHTQYFICKITNIYNKVSYIIL